MSIDVEVGVGEPPEPPTWSPSRLPGGPWRTYAVTGRVQAIRLPGPFVWDPEDGTEPVLVEDGWVAVVPEADNQMRAAWAELLEHSHAAIPAEWFAAGFHVDREA